MFNIVPCFIFYLQWNGNICMNTLQCSLHLKQCTCILQTTRVPCARSHTIDSNQLKGNCRIRIHVTIWTLHVECGSNCKYMHLKTNMHAVNNTLCNRKEIRKIEVRTAQHKRNNNNIWIEVVVQQQKKRHKERLKFEEKRRRSSSIRYNQME